MKHILCLIDSLGPGGAQRQLMGLARFLKDEGYDVTIGYYHCNNFYEDQFQEAGVKCLYFQKAQKGLLRQWYLMKYVRDCHPDVLISYLESPSIRSCITKLFYRNFQLIVSERNTTQHTSKNDILRFGLFNLADYIVPNSYAQEEYIKTHFPNLSKKLVTIPNFVDLDYFMPPLTHKIKKVPEIIVAATIWASKNTLGFIDAIAKLRKKGRLFHVSWYGKNTTHINYFNECQQKIIDLNLTNYIELKEKTNKIKDCYLDADFFCLPSFYEGTPNVLCEAMACGLPVTCSNVCDNSRYVIDGENGFLFDPNDSETIASALERLLSLDEDSYESFCRKSRERAELLLSRERFVKSYIELIEN